MITKKQFKFASRVLDLADHALRTTADEEDEFEVRVSAVSDFRELMRMARRPYDQIIALSPHTDKQREFMIEYRRLAAAGGVYLFV